MAKTFQRPRALFDCPTHYCPGCTHGIIHRLVAETIDELDIRGRTVGIAPVGCAVMAYNYIDCDFQEAAHGRAPAMATGIKRVRPDLMVFTYQGDGDLASIGMGEIIHAANRGEKFTTIFVNNAIYGMTGGQMAPTTVLGMETTTSPGGRLELRDGAPLDLSEMLGLAEGSVYIERTSVARPKGIRKTKKALKKAFTLQMENRGFTLVEILSPCPTNWKMSSVAAAKWVEEEMTKIFPPKVIKDVA
jgi:2-oxoglutarate ferredoxin oxidoreductase subunit beta